MTATLPEREVAAVTLSTALRERTRDAHETAENSAFVGDLLAGRHGIEAYALLAAQHRAIYRAIEDATAGWVGDRVAGPFVIPELLRSDALTRDLATLLGPGWETEANRMVLGATLRYVEHVRAVGTSWPAGFVAHHYVRYLGDLSGGQIVRRGLHEVFGPGVAGATRFYEFTGIPKVKPFRDAYRTALDALPLDSAESELVVAEAVRAFHFNHAVFVDLAERCPTRSASA